MKSINVHSLQAKASKIVKDVEAGENYTVMRYSKPVAILISQKEYECLTGQCRGCVKNFIKEFKANK